MIFHTLLCSIIIVPMFLLRVPRHIIDIFIGRCWCQVMLKTAGIEIEVKGRENVPLDRGYLFLFTHSSHFDIPTLFCASPKGFRFGAKSSLFKIPFFGSALALSGTLPIARESRSKVMEVYRQAEARVAQGEAFALAPEGGRRTGDDLRDFKSGPFLFALNANMPIVPAVIMGVDRVLANKSIWINTGQWKKKVAVSFLPAIDISNFSIDQIKDLKSKVREDMVHEFESLKPIYN